MTALVARTGRHQQRYDKEFRLVAGCIPYRYRGASAASNGDSDKAFEVLMITSEGRQGLLFPKGGWEIDESIQEAACREALEEAGVRGIIKKNLGTWDFRSKSHQGDCGPEGCCRACMFALFVTEQLDSWPEQNARQRRWVTITEAVELCRYDWMREALQSCVSYLFNRHTISPLLSESDDSPVSNNCSSQLPDQKQL